MIEYLIIVCSFAIMVQINYVMEVLRNVKDVQELLLIEKDMKRFNPFGFSVTFFVYCTIFAPALALYIFFVPKNEVIKDLTGTILKSYFKLDDK